MLRTLPSLLVATLPTIAFAQCDDTCSTANNGVCDSTCAIGTDCTDCAEADRIRDILVIVFGVGTGLGAIALCYWTVLKCRQSSPAPDVEKAVPSKAADTASDKAKEKKAADAKPLPQKRTILGVEVEAVAPAEKKTDAKKADSKKADAKAVAQPEKKTDVKKADTKAEKKTDATKPK
jgi:hypothetical protein